MSILNIKQWDPQKFNKQFDDYINDINKRNEEENKKLEESNKTIIEKHILDYTLTEFLYGWKYTVINIINQLIHFNFSLDLLKSENNMFFIGFTILFIIICYVLLTHILNMHDSNTHINTNYKKIIYKYD